MADAHPDTAKRRDVAAEIALDGIDFKSIQLSDPVPLGRQLLTAGSQVPAEAFSLFAILPDGAFEDVRLDETFDLRAKGTERFIAFSGDRIFRLYANGREVKWGPETVSEAVLRFLTGADEDEAVFLEVRGGTDRLIKEGEQIDLTEAGVERFITAKRPRTYSFFVNGTKYETDQRRLTALQIKARVPNWDPNHDLVLEGHGDEPDGPVGDDELIDLDVKPARRFSSVPKANFG
ncbi:Multiubiquitin [Mesorhizobium albiziae]|uniref:Multiubiquitin n=1 Tax=Neomesorhizobium albiziae TaxID=335020 RepID=A0A1I4FCR6_9HYPH|nr:multiubiquitin domain-containing protein [Mesorhizobium albiziae]GLS33068.1 hypothetical protein GCM10007937_47790 [Mesorhizobium albiziae]SFL14606.1 Multiubiquitin [Mesorhizobium albiziae]